MKAALVAFALLSAGLCRSAYADQVCSARVQNDDLRGQAVAHLVVSPADQPASREDSVIVNRIVMPGRDNVAVIHWPCTKPDKTYRIAGMNAHGEYIVAGSVVPSTMDGDPISRPTALLESLSPH